MWTHGIRGIEFNYKDNRTFNGAVATAKIAAGMVVKDLLEAAASHNLTVVTASDHTVGIGGWLASGGHGPVTSRYGMGADQVVEIDVVTADGRLLTINANSYPDLFWAMRGVSSSLQLVSTTDGQGWRIHVRRHGLSYSPRLSESAWLLCHRCLQYNRIV